ncbi:MAG: glycosyltransferase family 4 protein [Gemmatimonadota bacterium]|nr:glycosyltransferase family 4 protein [Gemmatimonadota bacterium]
MRVLLLCDRYPYPLQNGQNLRIYHYVRHLRNGHTFDLLCYGDTMPPEELKEFFEIIVHFPPPKAMRRRGLDRLRHILSVGHMFPSSPEVRAHLEHVLSEQQYDVIWVSGWGMIVNVPTSGRRRLLADAVDDGVLEYWRELKQTRSVGRFLLMLKWLIMNYRFERRYFGPAARCLFVSETDAEAFHWVCPETPVSVVHNGVDERQFHATGLPIEPGTIVFEGNMNFRPNTDGIVTFCQDILPRVRETMPNVRVIVVGMDPPPEVRALAAPSVEVTGFVDDVRPFVERGAVFICPLRKGAGIKNKILQAWSMGKAVVATPASAGGLKVQEGHNILIRPLFDGFAEAVVALLQDPIRAAALGDAARKTVEQHYTWHQKAAELEKVMESIVAKAREHVDA